MVTRRRRRSVLRSWRSRRVQQVPAHQSEAAAALARRSRRRRRAGRLAERGRACLARPGRLMAPLAAIGLVAALAAVAITGAHRVRGAHVVGNQRVSAAAIYAASGLDGQSVLAADAGAAEQRVEALDGIRSARVQLRLPSRATITVVETTPALLWQTQTGVFAIDDRGVAAPPPTDPTGLVQVQDLSGTVKAVGDHVPVELVAAATAYGARFGNLRFEAGQGFRMITVEGWDVRLGANADAAARQANLLAAFRQKVAGSSPRLATIDLRFVNRPYYRLGGNAE